MSSVGGGPQSPRPLFAPSQHSPVGAVVEPAETLASVVSGRRPGEARFVRERSTACPAVQHPRPCKDTARQGVSDQGVTSGAAAANGCRAGDGEPLSANTSLRQSLPSRGTYACRQQRGRSGFAVWPTRGGRAPWSAVDATRTKLHASSGTWSLHCPGSSRAGLGPEGATISISPICALRKSSIVCRFAHSSLLTPSGTGSAIMRP